MNGSAQKIEIFAPFGAAFELTKQILFKPFDIGKWFVIGFAAFLANFVGGTTGSGFNFNFPNTSNRESAKQFGSTMRSVMPGGEDWDPWMGALLVAIFVLVFAIVVVIWWVGSRGQFIFTDCVVRNRAAIVAPWHEFKREGNSLFFFILISTAVLLLAAAVLALPVMLPIIWQKEPDFTFWVTLIGVVCVFLLLCLAFAILMQFVVPIMYRRRCRAWQAFKESIGLLRAYPVPIILYTLFFIVLMIAVVAIGCGATCATCCIAALPYIGTVILLPVHVFAAAYRLLFLRQFGPDYDVWADIGLPLPEPAETPPPASGGEPPVSPPSSSTEPPSPPPML